MAYRMLVTDMDDTLLNERSELNPRDREAILAAQARGVCFVLASGRPTYGMWPTAGRLRLWEYGGWLLSYNGAHILSAATREIVSRTELSREDLHLLYDCALGYGTDILTYKDDMLVSPHQGKYVLEDLALTKMPGFVPVDFKAFMDCGAPKCMLLAEPDYLAGVEKELKARFGKRFTITRSRPYFLEFVAPGVSKGVAMTKLAERLGIRAEEIIACGDSWNDLDMIEKAGFGVAVANANAEVRARADYVTAANTESGLAKVIEKYIMNEERTCDRFTKKKI